MRITHIGFAGERVYPPSADAAHEQWLDWAALVALWMGQVLALDPTNNFPSALEPEEKNMDEWLCRAIHAYKEKWAKEPKDTKGE